MSWLWRCHVSLMHTPSSKVLPKRLYEVNILCFFQCIVNTVTTLIIAKHHICPLKSIETFWFVGHWLLVQLSVLWLACNCAEIGVYYVTVGALGDEGDWGCAHLWVLTFCLWEEKNPWSSCLKEQSHEISLEYFPSVTLFLGYTLSQTSSILYLHCTVCL